MLPLTVYAMHLMMTYFFFFDERQTNGTVNYIMLKKWFVKGAMVSKDKQVR